MKFSIKAILCSVLVLLLCGKASAQNSGNGYDVFVPIAKYISQGDAEKLSAWFAPNLEVALLGKSSSCSSKQAKQIVKSFFEKNTPRSFKIDHTASQLSMKYALGTLGAGGETYKVTIFVSYKKDEYRIQQLKIEKQD